MGRVRRSFVLGVRKRQGGGGEKWGSHRVGGDSRMGTVRRSFVLGVRKRQGGGGGRSGGVTEWEGTVVWGVSGDHLYWGLGKDRGGEVGESQSGRRQ